jgi:hypothetical protein
MQVVLTLLGGGSANDNLCHQMLSGAQISQLVYRLGYRLENREVMVQFPAVARQQGHEVDNSSLFIAKVKNGGAMLPLSHMSTCCGI